MYYVRATVKNNLNSLTLPVVVVQVGDNVTSADVAVADWLRPVGAPVQLTIDCPRGWPVMLKVDMGDGQPPVIVRRPDTYDPVLDNRVTTPVPTTNAAPSPRRRDADDSKSVVGQPISVPAYHYRAPGNYRYVHQVTD